MKTDTTLARMLISDASHRPPLNSSAMPTDKNHAVAEQFEALLIHTMLKAMRATIPAGGLLQSQQGEMFMDMFDQQIASDISGGSQIGLADAIQRQINYAGSGQFDHQSQAAALPAVSTPPRSANVSAIEPAIRQTTGIHSSQANAPQQARVNDAQSQFLDKIRHSAELAADLLGTSSSAIMAIAAHESGWGQKVASTADGSSSFNLFGIKANRGWQGPRAQSATHELIDNRLQSVRAEFRAYSSADESIVDFAAFIHQNPRYRHARAVAQQPVQFIRELQQAGYATDPGYANKVIAVMDWIQQQLTRG